MKKEPVVQKAIESVLEEQSHEGLVFIVRTLIASGHVPEGLVRRAVDIASWVKMP